MSAVIAAPGAVEAAAADLATVGTTLDAAHAAAAAPTLTVEPAAADEVSIGIARLFSSYARDCQMVAAEVATLYERFIKHLTASAVSYAAAEAANVAMLMQPVAGAAGSLAVAAAAFDPLVYLNMMAGRLGTVINGTPALIAGLFQLFLTDPVGTLNLLPQYLTVLPALEALFVLAPLVPFAFDFWQAFPELGMLLNDATTNYLLWLQSWRPLLGPALFPVLLNLAYLPIIFAVAPWGLLLLLYYGTGGVLL